MFLLCFSGEGSNGLKNLLHFMTGCDSIPPLGLSKKIDLEFVDDSNSFFAETCTLVLRVPKGHTSFESFMEKIMEARLNPSGFGSV